MIFNNPLQTPSLYPSHWAFCPQTHPHRSGHTYGTSSTCPYPPYLLCWRHEKSWQRLWRGIPSHSDRKTFHTWRKILIVLSRLVSYFELCDRTSSNLTSLLSKINWIEKYLVLIRSSDRLTSSTRQRRMRRTRRKVLNTQLIVVWKHNVKGFT